jgi:hypothetical protein
VLIGGLIEFASHAKDLLKDEDIHCLASWNGVLSRQFSDREPYHLLLSIFDVLVRFKQTNDSRVLLELPLEQRRLIVGEGYPGT